MRIGKVPNFAAAPIHSPERSAGRGIPNAEQPILASGGQPHAAGMPRQFTNGQGVRQGELHRARVSIQHESLPVIQ